MLPAPFKVVLDANVLYPFTLRDTLLRAAAEDLFQVYWSAKILDEAIGNLVKNTTITGAQGTHLRAAMEKAFPEAMVTGYESLVAGLANDPKDRHVVAAALKAGAQVIVTLNRDDLLPDPGDHRVDVPLHLPRGDTEHRVAEKLELPLTESVVPLLPVVGAAIDFDDERRSRDEDVHDVGTEDHLATSAKAEGVARAQRAPQELL